MTKQGQNQQHQPQEGEGEEKKQDYIVINNACYEDGETTPLIRFLPPERKWIRHHHAHAAAQYHPQRLPPQLLPQNNHNNNNNNNNNNNKYYNYNYPCFANVTTTTTRRKNKEELQPQPPPLMSIASYHHYYLSTLSLSPSSCDSLVTTAAAHEHMILLEEEEEERLAAKAKCWTLTACFTLLVVALACGTLVLSTPRGGDTDNPIFFSSIHFAKPQWWSSLGESSSSSDVYNRCHPRNDADVATTTSSDGRDSVLHRWRSLWRRWQRRRLGCPPQQDDHLAQPYYSPQQQQQRQRQRQESSSPSLDSLSSLSLDSTLESSVQQEQQQSQQDSTTTGTLGNQANPSLLSSWYSGSGNNNNRLPPRVKSVGSAFPSFLDFQGAPIHVTYNAQSLQLNQESVLLLGGSLHPTRASSQTQWENALDEAVHNGLNLITLYIFWSAHQPYAQYSLDYTLPYSQVLQEQVRTTTTTEEEEVPKSSSSSSVVAVGVWELADAILSCANRGLFVHLRLGPYACGEYSYGGIPEWIGLHYPNIRFRRMDPDWLRLMEAYVQNTTAYITQHGLWAHQGGPIVLAQVENELGDDDDDDIGFMQQQQQQQPLEDARGSNKRVDNSHVKTEAQQYADWCGELVQRVAPPGIVWTMCNGLSANNTIETFNGNNEEGIEWLQRHGENGRIQRDQPALWTEHEQGFQLWGESPDHAVDYFWGLSAQTISRNVIRWIARGGFHMNYYMWWGGYNRGRMAAAGILNAYANDAVLCPSGERRHPKFGHLTALHQVIASIAPILTATIPAKVQPVRVYNETQGAWTAGLDQVAFFYTSSSSSSTTTEEVLFLENNGNETVLVQIPYQSTSATTASTRSSSSSSSSSPLLEEPRMDQVLTMTPYSAVILVNRNIVYGSDTISPAASAFTRITRTEEDGDLGVSLLDWKSWREPVLSFATSPECTTTQQPEARSSHPVEQTELLHRRTAAQHNNPPIWSDYAWHSTVFTLEKPMDGGITVVVDTDKATSLVAYLDGRYQGTAENHVHGEGNIQLEIPLLVSALVVGRPYELTLLSESLGYHNLISRWMGSVGAKHKGIVGDVVLVSSHQEAANRKNISLVDKDRLFSWCSVAALQGERTGLTQRRPPPMRSTGVKEEKEDHVMKKDVVWDNLIQLSNAAPNHHHNSYKSSDDDDDDDDGPLWRKASFDTPLLGVNQQLFLEVTFGRGHLWLNGHDLGRFWNITRSDRTNITTNKDKNTTNSRHNDIVMISNGDGSRIMENDSSSSSNHKNNDPQEEYSQRFYHLPLDLLRTDGSLNELVIVNVVATPKSSLFGDVVVANDDDNDDDDDDDKINNTTTTTTNNNNGHHHEDVQLAITRLEATLSHDPLLQQQSEQQSMQHFSSSMIMEDVVGFVDSCLL